MDDTIYRQAAIEAIDAVFPVDPMKSEYAQGIACGAALAKTYIEQLPSAQPEIILCKDCRHNHDCNIQYHAQAGEEFYCGVAERRIDEKNQN